jgi:hypothetical protein
MYFFFPRSLITLVLASLAKAGVAENRKKPRQLFNSNVFSKDKDDKEPRRLLAHLASRTDKTKQVHPRTTAMDATGALTNAEREPHNVVVRVVNAENDNSDPFDGGILASSGRNRVVSDDVPSGLTQREL